MVSKFTILNSIAMLHEQLSVLKTGKTTKGKEDLFTRNLLRKIPGYEKKLEDDIAYLERQLAEWKPSTRKSKSSKARKSRKSRKNRK
jgi:hypothetical protein